MSAKRDDARLIRNLMDLMDVSPYEAKRLLGIVTTAMADAIRRDEKVRMDGIGWFYPYRKAGYWNNGVAKRGKGRQETYVPDRRLVRYVPSTPLILSLNRDNPEFFKDAQEVDPNSNA